MGLILIFYIGIGLVAGMLLGIPCIVAGCIILVRNHKARQSIWKMAAIGIAVGLFATIAVVQNLPLKPVRPGSDYDVAANNLLITTVGYTLAPALAFVIGSLFTRLSPPRVLAPPPLPALPAGA